MRAAIEDMCERVGMSRQNFYKARKHRMRRQVDADLVEQLVKSYRRLQPRLGGRKLFHMCRMQLDEAGVRIGRDLFFSVLKEKGLLVDPLPKSPRTTNSRHYLPVFGNLIKERIFTAPNQAMAGDITYIRTDEGFLYLSLLTDLYSRKIVGYDVGDTLEVEGCLRTLTMAIAGLPEAATPILHSDRGSQYCSHPYVNQARERGLIMSMTEENHCYENALAERVNGILKQEYGLGCQFRSKAQAVKAIQQAIELYNHHRPHWALKYRTPAEVHAAAA